MNTIRILYHLMRADFFERAHRYSFLITIGLTIYVAYLYLLYNSIRMPALKRQLAEMRKINAQVSPVPAGD